MHAFGADISCGCGGKMDDGPIVTGAVERARAAIARGDLITAFDEAVSAIAAGDSSAGIRHQQVLALARMGDAERAMQLFQLYGLDRSDDPHQKAVGARLLKDQALATASAEGRLEALNCAFAAYRAIFAESADPYPGINAASLALLCGRQEEALSLAQSLLALRDVAGFADYYAGATRAEALLIVGRLEEAIDTLRQAIRLLPRDYGARSSTCRQLGLLADHLGLDQDGKDRLLAPVRPPAVLHYCGHMFWADDDAEASIAIAIRAMLTERDVGFAYGSLASGGDILIAEAVLARGAELHLVFPFVLEDFIEQSVRPGGEPWLPRFERCLAAATTQTFASETHYVGDPGQFGYASLVAMGQASLRAQHLGVEAFQIAISDGVIGAGPAGTGADIAVWRARGGETHIIAPGKVDRALVRPAGHDQSDYERMLAAIIFTDFPGFSKLPEAALPAFWDGVMRCVADVLDQHGDDILCRNSWGDALYAVASSVQAAAHIALELQNRLRDFDYTSLGLTQGAGMRIGAHYGPVYRTLDHVTGRITFYGTEVSRAARIEPVTPPGAVFVTEPFAAILALEAQDSFHSRYVGRIELAKGYGAYPMYRLTRAGRND